MIKTIAHATDFSPAGADAFAHALRLAVEFRSQLDLLHVKDPTDDDAWSYFPHVRETLARWELLPAHATQSEITAQTGVTVRKVEIRDSDAVRGITQFLLSHRPDLLVMSTHGRDGLNRWLAGSVSEGIARQTHLPTMFLGPQARPFVDKSTGNMHLQNLVIPVAKQPSPRHALNTLAQLLEPLIPTQHLVHIGDTAPLMLDASGTPLSVQFHQGPVIETILKAADMYRADLLVMPTAGHNGFLDALRGSTTERILHQAHCPLLALPA
jgi:nucleotide-binding universal stress UspA family protein